MSTVSRRSVLAALGAAAIPPVAVAVASPAYAADKFGSNTELYGDADYTEGVDWARRFRRHAALDDSEAPGGVFPDTAIIALHGGGIEPGTSELCLAIAGYDPKTGAARGGPVYDYWMFEGLMAKDNGLLHVTSANCDDPAALATVGGSSRTVSLHGCSAGDAGFPDKDTRAVLVGGRDAVLRAAVIAALQNRSITAIDALTWPAPQLDGTHVKNIVNLNVPKAGVQLELTTKLRDDMFGLNTRAGRKTTMNDLFWHFADGTREALAA